MSRCLAREDNGTDTSHAEGGRVFSRLTALLALCLISAAAQAYTVVVRERPETPQGRYAERRLQQDLTPIEVAGRHPRLLVDLAIDPALGAEAFTTWNRRHEWRITGGDARGLVYGALALREHLINGR